VSEVLRVQEDAIEPPPPMVTTINSAFITGIAKVGERLIILLDLARILTVSEKDEMVNLEAAV
jgi:purine-binding chemotaxis protein CheW